MNVDNNDNIENISTYMDSNQLVIYCNCMIFIYLLFIYSFLKNKYNTSNAKVLTAHRRN